MISQYPVTPPRPIRTVIATPETQASQRGPRERPMYHRRTAWMRLVTSAAPEA